MIYAYVVSPFAISPSLAILSQATNSLQVIKRTLPGAVFNYLLLERIMILSDEIFHANCNEEED
jgi:hypothetical protein